MVSKYNIKNFLPRMPTMDLLPPFEVETGEKRIVRQFDCKIVVVAFGICLTLDLESWYTGYSKIYGEESNLGVATDSYEWVWLAFDVLVILSSGMMLLFDMVPPRTIITFALFWKGILTSLQSVVTSIPTIIALRVLDGPAEALLLGIPLYLSLFFKSEELGLRIGVLHSSMPILTVFGSIYTSSLAIILQHFSSWTWRILLLLSGLPLLVFASISWHMFPNNPETASYLSDEQRIVAETRLRPAPIQHRPFRGKLSMLRDSNFYLPAFLVLLSNMAYAPMPSFMKFGERMEFSVLPWYFLTVVDPHGRSFASYQILIALPYLLALSYMLFTSYLSDRYRNRGTFILYGLCLSASGFFFMALVAAAQLEVQWQYPGIFAVTMGYFSIFTLIKAWSLENSPGILAKCVNFAALILAEHIGKLASPAGVNNYLHDDEPFHAKGLLFCTGCMILAIVPTMALKRHLTKTKKELEGDEDESQAFIMTSLITETEGKD